MDRIEKALQKLASKEKKELKIILESLKHNRLEGFDVMKLKGYQDIYRIRKGKLRIIFIMKAGKINILAIERRSENTYNI